VKKLASATDPLWYKDAVLYELHVRAFQDSNGDGIGDFPGLLSRLDYLQDLGVTCLWLLPFFPSPLRDDGYDIADYTSVNPSYGTLDDFKEFLDAAHARNMQVMIELVINHTSDQHPWFQRARLAPKGSPERDMYVWSDSDRLYEGVRIIFTDTEKSNWAWDEAAQQYYWHRFFSHQPDLNFDNPRVLEEVLAAMRFWLDLGVDGLRLDAIPYLIERDGTSCENVPETHVLIRKIRAVLDAEYENRVILAEANMWPADVRPYFGSGDECHMAFHFPLMPRIYMALRQEDRLPITDIMAQTPPIPANCQWGLFLRNHDELTLEMVTEEERDYMYYAYSADPRMRVNVGIRRRLAPLVDNNRRRIELLNSLLLSFPGTPILYYGDELGMGDNIYLGDRNGVRTPMQWNSDRNAGFSKAVPARLYFPVIMDPVWGYQAINVEAQQADPSSLLHWTRNMIALRKLFQVFGRGTLEFLNPENRKVLAYLRRYDPASGSTEETAATHPQPSSSVETVLCVANLSRFAQPVSLDLAQFSGSIPVEMLGYVSFPPISAQPYPLTLAPYSFLWFELQPAPPPPPIPAVPAQPQAAPLSVTTLDEVFAGPALPGLLAAWLPRQRWFAAKSRTVQSIRLLDRIPLPGTTAVLTIIDIAYTDATAETYQLPLAISTGEQAEQIRASHPAGILTQLPGDAILHDGVLLEDFRQSLLGLIARNTAVDSKLLASHTEAFPPDPGPLSCRLGSAEQSNTSFFYEDKFFLKLFRRLQPGENPDLEVTRFLTTVAHFPRIASLLGEIAYPPRQMSLAMLQPMVENEGDGWQWTLDELAKFYESVANCPPPAATGRPATLLDHHTVPAEALREVAEHDGISLQAAALLGRRTAELHLALAAPTGSLAADLADAFTPEPFRSEDLAADAERLQSQITATLAALEHAALNDPMAAELLARREQLLNRARALTQAAPEKLGQRIRIHGDFHLGQLLVSRGDFIFLDFEGEPARPLAERRRKQTPLRDVAGMLRSFSYAAYSALDAFTHRHPQVRSLGPWAELWQNAASAEFLRAWRDTLSANPALLPAPEEAQRLLDLSLLEKSLYELLYELNNRPSWAHIPLAGIAALLT
jgi:maltose alpha-D-glucosyltransferase/alpha-amylase